MSTSSTTHLTKTTHLVSWVAVGLTTIVIFYPLVRRAVHNIRTRARPLPYSACDNAADATRFALSYIRAGRIRTLGELVYMLRGAPQKMCTTEAKPRRNAFFLRLPLEYLLFLQESYLPATRIKPTKVAAAAAGRANTVSSASLPALPTHSTSSHPTADVAQTANNASSSANERKMSNLTSNPTANSNASTNSVHETTERHMFSQLLAVSTTLRGIEVQRATAWSSENDTHVQLLQQLWVAAGLSLASFTRTGPRWAELGFQGDDPVTDIRGGGVLALRQLVHFAQSYPAAWQEMMAYNAAEHAAQGHAWYLPAVVSFQITTHLALQREWELSLAHLQVVYDTVVVRENLASELVSKGESLTPYVCYAVSTHTADADSVSAISSSASSFSAATSTSTEAAATLPQPKRCQLISRPSLAKAMGNVSLSRTSSSATADFWRSYASDGEAGFHLLHHALLLHFKQCWERDRPHVMEFNSYVATRVYATFFSPSWSYQA